MPQYLSTDEIRRRWIAFFAGAGHKHVPSDSLVPQNDPSVLFTGAGMNQFKDHFLGRAKLDHPQQRAVAVQKCLRTADIDNVGRTPNHHTFFEMLGNFSFGDYFKKEAVQWGWEFCTDPARGLGLEPERLSVTIYGGNAALGIARDEEAALAWKEAAPALRNKDGAWRIYEYGDHDNFWPADAPAQGPNGPCGPCSEIYYDMKPEQGPPEPVADSKDPYRYVEIWNLVFTQFNRVDVGKLEPLSQKNIDTGAGLERIARVLQQKSNNYEIDLLFPVVETVAKIAGKQYGKDAEDGRRMRRITDHTRAAVFCIADGVAPKNEGRNYVVRRLMRRAILDGQELGIKDAFLGEVAKTVVTQMSVGYPELTPRTETLVRLIEEEEAAFSRTLRDGQQTLEESFRLHVFHDLTRPNSKLRTLFAGISDAIRRGELIVSWPDDKSREFNPTVTYKCVGPRPGIRYVTDVVSSVNAEYDEKRSQIGKIPHGIVLDHRAAFRLWDTFGLPIELTTELAQSQGLQVNMTEFKQEMEEAVKRSQAGSAIRKEVFDSGPVAELKKRFAGQPTTFVGYGTLRVDNARALAIVQGDALVDTARPDGEAIVLLDQTPFYAESGGQVGDKGWLISGAQKHAVLDTHKQEGLFLHRVTLSGPLAVGDTVSAVVDEDRRGPTVRNHSATHLLHKALRAVLGTHVEQRGSFVAPERLRFDFTHFEQIKPEQLVEIERQANEMVAADLPVDIQELPIAEARAKGAMALFGEKYGERVRVVSMGPSIELCGGTHCRSTGQIGYVRIISESSIAAGVRRMEALTGAAAVADARKTDEQLSRLALLLRTKKEAVHERVVALQEEKAAVERKLESLRKKAATAAAGELLGNVQDVAGVKLLAAQIAGADAAALRTTLDGIRKTFKEGAVVLGGVKEGKVALLVNFSPEIVKRGGHAGNLLKALAPKVGGKGGGKPDMAQGGGTDAAKLPEALEAVAGMLGAMIRGQPHA
ncbi:MAG: alanine--tRNA ligase [Planctomycetota bacterium]|nr:alanine--tRNA ligase [Planctomycetota bacterium]